MQRWVTFLNLNFTKMSKTSQTTIAFTLIVIYNFGFYIDGEKTSWFFWCTEMVKPEMSLYASFVLWQGFDLYTHLLYTGLPMAGYFFDILMSLTMSLIPGKWTLMCNGGEPHCSTSLLQNVSHINGVHYSSGVGNTFLRVAYKSLQ